MNASLISLKSKWLQKTKENLNTDQLLQRNPPNIQAVLSTNLVTTRVLMQRVKLSPKSATCGNRYERRITLMMKPLETFYER